MIARHTAPGIIIPQLSAVMKMVCQSSREYLLQLPEKKGTRNMGVSVLPERSPVKHLSKSRSLNLGDKVGKENRSCHSNGEISTAMPRSK